MQCIPAAAFALLGLDGGLFFLDPFSGSGVVLQLEAQTSDDIAQLPEGFFIGAELRLQLLQGLIGDLALCLGGQPGLTILLPGVEVGLLFFQCSGPCCQLGARGCR